MLLRDCIMEEDTMYTLASVKLESDWQIDNSHVPTQRSIVDLLERYNHIEIRELLI
jgi:hypothetical protein